MSGVCAGLELAVRSGRIASADHVLLHITGGGQERVGREFEMHRLIPRCGPVRHLDDVPPQLFAA